VAGAGIGATGAGAPLSAATIALGLWTIRGGLAHGARAKQLFDEASDECGGSLKNLLGILPFGQHFDDPEESFTEYFRDMLNKPASQLAIDLLTYGTYQE